MYACKIFHNLIYTILSVPPSFHTDPAGKPAELVGIFIIDKLLTNVVQLRFAVISEPTIIDLKQDTELHAPPSIAERLPDTVLREPPPINE